MCVSDILFCTMNNDLLLNQLKQIYFKTIPKL